MTELKAQAAAAPVALANASSNHAAARAGVVLIPALNEERSIRAVVLSAERYCEKVIVIDDGSTDGTEAVIADLAIERIRHVTPQGKALALRDGFKRALELGYDGVLTMDGDGQHDAADLPRLLAAAKQYPNHIVIGARLLDKQAQPNKNRLANQQADFWVSWVCGQSIVDTQSGQRYYPRAVVELALTLPHDGFVFESEILIEAAKRGIRAVSVPIKTSYEEGRRASHFKPVRDVTRIVGMIARHMIPAGFLPANYRRARSEPAIVVDTH